MKAQNGNEIRFRFHHSDSFFDRGSLGCDRYASLNRAHWGGSEMFDRAKIQPHIMFSDLREWMREADKLGELKTILGASWQEDIGLATDVVVPPDDGPAVIFDE